MVVILNCTPSHRRSQVTQIYEHMNIPRSKAERDPSALNARRLYVRVRPIARSSSRSFRRCAQLAERPRTRRDRRWRPPAQASSTAPVRCVSCEMLGGDRGWRGSGARTLSQSDLASLLPPSAGVQSGALAHRGQLRHNPGHAHTTMGKVSTGAGIARRPRQPSICPAHTTRSAERTASEASAQLGVGSAHGQSSAPTDAIPMCTEGK
jgi:hypothetical protein